MMLNDQIYGTNGNSRILSDLKDEIRNSEKKIKAGTARYRITFGELRGSVKNGRLRMPGSHDGCFSLSLVWS